jgi:hypothetical protein
MQFNFNISSEWRMLKMKRNPGLIHAETDKALMWDQWRKGVLPLPL